MAQTVIGFFEDASDAQKAADRLQSLGISRDHVDISRGSSEGRNVGVDRDDDHENGITRFFNSLFGNDKNDVERYSSVGRNSTIVTVHTQTADQAERAAEIMDDCGAIDVDERAAQYGYQANSSTGDDYTRDEDTTIDRVQENLEIGKREVERGGVRVRSRIVERPIEESIRLREENVYVERNPVDRPISDSDNAAFQDRDIELTERAEVPVVNKEARVVEEIRVGKEVTEHNETIRDTVRDTEVDIDRTDNTRKLDDDFDISDSRRGL